MDLVTAVAEGVATIAATSSKMFGPEPAAPRREEDAMISTRTEAAGKIGCSADHRGHLVGQG